ncbi:MAG: FecR domain-containing protein, partial [Chitinophagaceae bacterium]
MSELESPNQNENQLPFSFKVKEVSDASRESNWKAVEKGIDHLKVVRLRTKRIIQFSIAAISIGIVSIFLFSTLTKSKETGYQIFATTFGEKKRIVLPDSSVVVLNANSSFKMPESWDAISDRQVWLEGEAFFEVEKKIATQQKFIVHTKDVDISVLGTKFNVNTRKEKSVVALEEGKIQLIFVDKTKGEAYQSKTSVVKTIAPGEVATIDEEKNLIVKIDKQISLRSAWVRNEFHFDETPLTEIALLLKEQYGYKVEFKNINLDDKILSGDLRAAIIVITPIVNTKWTILITLMIVKTVKAIKKGEELFINYNGFCIDTTL